MARKAWLANKDSPSAAGCSSSFAFPLAAAQRLLQCGQPAKLGNKDLFYLLRLLNHGHSCLLGEKVRQLYFPLAVSRVFGTFISECSHTCFNVLYGNGETQQVKRRKITLISTHVLTMHSVLHLQNDFTGQATFQTHKVNLNLESAGVQSLVPPN